MLFIIDFMKFMLDCFIYELFVEYLYVVEVVVGENFIFGKKVVGNVDMLCWVGEWFGFVVELMLLVFEYYSNEIVMFFFIYIWFCVDVGDMVVVMEVLG